MKNWNTTKTGKAGSKLDWNGNWVKFWNWNHTGLAPFGTNIHSTWNKIYTFDVCRYMRTSKRNISYIYWHIWTPAATTSTRLCATSLIVKWFRMKISKTNHLRSGLKFTNFAICWIAIIILIAYVHPSIYRPVVFVHQFINSMNTWANTCYYRCTDLCLFLDKSAWQLLPIVIMPFLSLFVSVYVTFLSKRML